MVENTTRINREIGSETRVNPSVGGTHTVVNPDILSESGTQINPVVNDLAELDVLGAGSVLLDRFVIEQKLNVSTGEADIYLCSYNGKLYVAKIYRRETSIKQEVVDAIQRIDSPYIAKISEIGLYKGRTVEILPYYSKGSLSGKTFPYQKIQYFVACLNEALHTLHQIGIIHKDLKPSNVMFWDDEKGVSVIDFGISSITRDGQTVLVTKTGMTPEYSAPETLHNLFLEESDYYSLGITIYEMFCGHTPYSNLTTEEIAQYSLVQQFPFPENMPKELVDLIKGLTYADITHRNEKKNPNRRWIYDEVVSWCKGEKLPVPGEFEQVEIGMRPYPFKSKTYKTMSSLIKALAENWNFGKKELFRGSLSGFFKTFNPEIAGICMDQEDAMASKGGSDDYYFFELLYKLDPNLTHFYWKDISYISLQCMGRNILYNLRMQKNQESHLLHEILNQKIISCYLNYRPVGNSNLNKTIKWLEEQHGKPGRDAYDFTTDYYLLGYILSGEKEFYYEKQFLTKVSQLVKLLNNRANVSMQSFEEACSFLINCENERLYPQLEAWLFVLGKGKLVNEWKRGKQLHV